MANNDLVGSVVKAMALVKITAAAPDGLKICELAEAANLKNVTCFNLVRTLIAGGFLDRINGRVYVGSEITRLAGNRFQTGFFRAAEDSLLKVNRAFPRATVIFAVPGKSGMEQTHRISFDHPGVIQRLNNEIMPPYASAAGLLGLAFISDEEVNAFADAWRARGKPEYVDMISSYGEEEDMSGAAGSVGSAFSRCAAAVSDSIFISKR